MVITSDWYKNRIKNPVSVMEVLYQMKHCVSPLHSLIFLDSWYVSEKENFTNHSNIDEFSQYLQTGKITAWVYCTMKYQSIKCPSLVIHFSLLVSEMQVLSHSSKCGATWIIVLKGSDVIGIQKNFGIPSLLFHKRSQHRCKKRC